MGRDNILYSSLFIPSPPVLLSSEIQQTSDQKIWFLILQRQEERTSNNFFFSQVICSWRCWCCPNRVCLEIVDYFYLIYLFILIFDWNHFLSTGINYSLSWYTFTQRDTPIHPWNFPNLPEGFSLSIKRDDLTGSNLSGNKVKINIYCTH